MQQTNGFDPDYYRWRYPELSSWDDAQVGAHWVQYGEAENRQGAPLPNQPSRYTPFDVDYYRLQNPDLAAFSDYDLRQHWIDAGYQENRPFYPRKSPVKFDPVYYRWRYPDLTHLNDYQLEEHWIDSGFADGRKATPQPHHPSRYLPFDVEYYRQKNPDLGALDDFWLREHWIESGYRENRPFRLRHSPIPIDPAFYRWKYPDLSELDDEQALDHWLSSGFVEGRVGAPLNLPTKNSDAIVALMISKHLSALRTFLASLAPIVILTDLVTPALLNVAKEFECEVVTITDFAWYNLGNEGHAHTIQHDLEQFVSENSAEIDKRFGPDLDFSVSSVIDKEFQRELPQIVALADGLEFANQWLNIRLIVTSEDWFTTSRLASSWARAHKIPTLHISDSILQFGLNTYCFKPTKDIVTVFGARGADPYLDAGYAPELLRYTGNPAWDTYVSMMQDRDEIRKCLIEQLGLNPDLPLVTFATSIAGEYGDARLAPFVWEQTLSTFLSAAKQLIESGTRLNIVIKEKPRSVNTKEFVMNFVQNSGIDPSLVAYSQESAESFVLASDVLVASDSNIHYEAMLVGTPAISLPLAMFVPYAPIFSAGDGIVYADESDLAQKISRMLGDSEFRELKIAELKQAAPRYNYGWPDGMAHARVASVMRTLYGE